MSCFVNRIIANRHVLLDIRIIHRDMRNIPIRIAALNCPENDTPEGQFASEFALQFKGLKVICELTGAMSYKRLVGYCRIGKTDFATTLIENTNCKIWQKYDVWQRYSE